MIKKITELTGLHPDRIHADIEKEKARNKEEYLAVQKIIAPFKQYLLNDPKSKIDKQDELLSLGKFILVSQLDMQIVVPEKELKYPDFIVKLERKSIGIEHTRLINEKMIGATKTAKQFLQGALLLLQQDHSDLSGIVNVEIDFTVPVIGKKTFYTRGFTTDERNQLKKTLADYIYSVLIHEHGTMPDYIKAVDIGENPGFPLSIELSERYFAIGGFKELLLDRIAAKEKRYKSYHVHSQLDRIWLFVVLDGVSSHSGFDLKNELFLYEGKSEFELIIVFDVFNGKYYLIYDKNRNANPA